MKAPQKILAPTDFSEIGQAAVNYACEYARLYGAELHLLNVVDNLVAFYPDATLMAASECALDLEGWRENSERRLAALPGERGRDLGIVRSVEFGSPPWAILQYAKDNDIDMIVVSTHGHTGLKHLFLGSVAEKIVRHANCAVLTIRPDGFEQDFDTTDETLAEQVGAV